MQTQFIRCYVSGIDCHPNVRPAVPAADGPLAEDAVCGTLTVVSGPQFLPTLPQRNRPCDGLSLSSAQLRCLLPRLYSGGGQGKGQSEGIVPPAKKAAVKPAAKTVKPAAKTEKAAAKPEKSAAKTAKKPVVALLTLKGDYPRRGDAAGPVRRVAALAGHVRRSASTPPPPTRTSAPSG